MKQTDQLSEVIKHLRGLGILAKRGDAKGEPYDFALHLPTSEGQSLMVSLESLPFLSVLDSEHVGLALLDAHGYVKSKWGLATKLPIFKLRSSLLLSDVGPVLGDVLDGSPKSIYHDGIRFYFGQDDSESRGFVVLVTAATEERSAQRRAHLLSRESNALRRLGSVLNMNSAVAPLAYAAVHEIVSSNGLAAGLLWGINKEEKALELLASTGITKEGTQMLSRLSLDGGSSSLAEIVAGSRQPFYLPDVHQNLITAHVEAKMCYLEPLAAAVWPLISCGNVIGVLELISKDGDDLFDQQLELFATLAEHVSLAINSAFLFESIERLASHDPMTGIANHRTLLEFLNQRFEESHRTGEAVSVLMIDVDHFRTFNEEEGHEAGDQVLKLVADALKAAVRPYDLAARYGGEEFTIVLPKTMSNEAMGIAERVRRRVSEIPLQTRSGTQRTVTVSIGCATAPLDGADATTLIRAADMALYDAKRSGRNRVESARSAA